MSVRLAALTGCLSSDWKSGSRDRPLRMSKAANGIRSMESTEQSLGIVLMSAPLTHDGSDWASAPRTKTVGVTCDGEVMLTQAGYLSTDDNAKPRKLLPEGGSQL